MQTSLLLTASAGTYVALATSLPPTTVTTNDHLSAQGVITSGVSTSGPPKFADQVKGPQVSPANWDATKRNDSPAIEAAHAFEAGLSLPEVDPQVADAFNEITPRRLNHRPWGLEHGSRELGTQLRVSWRNLSAKKRETLRKVCGAGQAWKDYVVDTVTETYDIIRLCYYYSQHGMMIPFD
ncbi:hypothetical protein IWQ60_007172 [Tieghemiomyces parasiticus]|uniref:Uncharacterized protein n=1 Tax=Tieghemiomyces parasiticus TaxID=78921 RepID=A0A9W8A7A6_9FUNG|nr:hypothetical protein IWQ60_007172 [Tieghemiomyces parasiticus]